VYAGAVGDDDVRVASDLPRPLSQREHRLLEHLLEQAFVGVEELRAQVGGVRIVAVSRRKGLLRLQFAQPPGVRPAPVMDELPVEASVRDAWPPRTLCLYVQDGLLDALELGDAAGADVGELPDAADLDPAWAHRAPAPLPEALCASLSRSLTSLAPSGTRVGVSATADGYSVHVRHGRLGMTRSGSRGPNDDERRSVIAILEFVQQSIARNEGRAWPAPKELREPTPERPLAHHPPDMQERRRLLDAHIDWVRSLPRSGATVTADGIRAWYGPASQPEAELDLST
jgi:hypothetical protein